MSHLSIHQFLPDTTISTENVEIVVNCLHTDWEGMKIVYSWLSKNLTRKQFQDLKTLFAHPELLSQ